jgi:hypothetical protein
MQEACAGASAALPFHPKEAPRRTHEDGPCRRYSGVRFNQVSVSQPPAHHPFPSPLPLPPPPPPPPAPVRTQAAHAGGAHVGAPPAVPPPVPPPVPPQPPQKGLPPGAPTQEARVGTSPPPQVFRSSGYQVTGIQVIRLSGFRLPAPSPLPPPPPPPPAPGRTQAAHVGSVHERCHGVGRERGHHLVGGAGEVEGGGSRGG